MVRNAEATRGRILEAAYQLFYRKGYSRVGVDEIAAQAGVTKRTLYYHFESKDVVLTAMLELQSDIALSQARRWSVAEATDPADFVRRLFRDVAKWSSKPGWSGAGYSRLVMELGDLPGHPARAVAKRHKVAIEAWIAESLSALGTKNAAVRAREVVLLLEGTGVATLVHSGKAYAEAAERAAVTLVQS